MRIVLSTPALAAVLFQEPSRLGSRGHGPAGQRSLASRGISHDPWYEAALGAYALARSINNAPLLFKGRDFIHTDIIVALPLRVPEAGVNQ